MWSGVSSKGRKCLSAVENEGMNWSADGSCWHAGGWEPGGQEGAAGEATGGAAGAAGADMHADGAAGPAHLHQAAPRPHHPAPGPLPQPALARGAPNSHHPFNLKMDVLCSTGYLPTPPRQLYHHAAICRRVSCVVSVILVLMKAHQY